MASVWGIAITNLTSKAGILSRKACMRYAEETGKKLVDKSRELGRFLNQAETEQVFAENLPKKCIPKIVSTPEEAAKSLVNSGLSHEKAMETLTQQGLGAATIMDGIGKRPIFMPFERFQNSVANQSAVAHELEHALEYNCKPKKIFRRIKDGLTCKFMSKIDKNYMDKRAAKECEIMKMQIYTQGNFGTFNFLVENPMENVLKIKPTHQDYIEFTGNSSEKRFLARLREYIRSTFASSKRYDKDNNRKLKWFIQTTDIEIPAYTVQGKVERYALNLAENQTPKATANAFLYEDAAKIMKRERYLYLKNRLTGKVRKTAEYKGEKSLTKLAKTSEDKQILNELIKDMNEDQKRELYCAMVNYPETLHNLNALVGATKVNGKSVWTRFPAVAAEMNPKAVENKDFLKIISMHNAEYNQPEYIGVLAELSHLSPEQLAKFVKLYDIKGADGALKYKYLFRQIDNPNFETFKKIADIEIGGKNPYAELVSYYAERTTPEEFERVHKLISFFAKQDKEVAEGIATAIYKRELNGLLKQFNI